MVEMKNLIKEANAHPGDPAFEFVEN